MNERTYPNCGTCGKLLPAALKNGYLPTVTPLLGTLKHIVVTMSDGTVTHNGQGFIGIVSCCQCSDVPQEFYDAFSDTEDWQGDRYAKEEG